MSQGNQITKHTSAFEFFARCINFHKAGGEDISTTTVYRDGYQMIVITQKQFVRELTDPK